MIFKCSGTGGSSLDNVKNKNAQPFLPQMDPFRAYRWYSSVAQGSIPQNLFFFFFSFRYLSVHPASPQLHLIWYLLSPYTELWTSAVFCLVLVPTSWSFLIGLMLSYPSYFILFPYKYRQHIWSFWYPVFAGLVFGVCCLSLMVPISPPSM